MQVSGRLPSCGCHAFSSHNGFRLLEQSFTLLRMVFLGLVLLSLQCMSVSHAEELSAETIPLYEKIITTPNQSAVLNCTVSSGGSIRSFTWKKGNGILRSVNSSAGAIYWLGLVLSGNTSSAGLYTCEVVDENGKTDTADVAVHVKGKPQIIRYKSSRSPKASTILHDVSLECYATGFPKPHLEWLRNGVKITGQGLNHKYSVEKVVNGLGSVLHIDGIKKEDDKAYFTCVASNQFGNATRRIRVYVLGDPLPSYRPTMTALSNQMHVNLGEPNVTLTCTGTYAERPYSTTFWKFKGVQYDSTNNNNASYFVYSEFLLANSSAGENTPKVRTSLVISNVSAQDKGNFTCYLVTTTTGDEPATDYIYLSVEETGGSDTRGKSQDLLVGLLVMGAVIVVGIIIVAFTCHFRNKEKNRMKKLAEKYDIDGNLFKNDVFITYSGKDYNWVDENLIPLFEEHGVQYIIHSRDFIPGKAIADNMADSVYESRKVLVVMSKNYMESGYCKEELQMALKRGLDDQGSPVIVLKIDKIHKKELPKSLRNKTFIDYTSKAEQQTWKGRLLDIVRVPVDGAEHT